MMLRVLALVAWMLRVSLAATFALSASGKLELDGNMAANFSRWGIPLAVMVCIGAVEALGAILLLVPSRNRLAIRLLGAVMSGAVFLHAKQFDELGWPILPAALIAGLWCLHATNRRVRG